MRRKVKRTGSQELHETRFIYRRPDGSTQLAPFIIGNVSRVQRDRFKAWCAVRGYTMSGKIRQYIERCINGEEE